MEDKYLPSSRTAVHVNTAGAAIIEDDDGSRASSNGSSSSIDRVEATVFGAGSIDGTPGNRDSRDIYLPKHTEWISHVAIDIGGSLAKIVYFSRTPNSNGSSSNNGGKGKSRETNSHSQQPPTNALHLDGSIVQHPSPRIPLFSPDASRPASPGRTTPVPNGVLGPESIASSSSLSSYFDRKAAAQKLESPPKKRGHHARGYSLSRTNTSTSQLAAGGYLNFTKFETTDIESCIEFINYLIETSALSHNIPVREFKQKHVKIMATGGGAHLFYDLLTEELQCEVRKEEEMECLIAGLGFFMEIPHEVFWYSDQLVHSISHPPEKGKPAQLPIPHSQEDLPRPSPNPPQYSLLFEENPAPQFPCMLVNIGSGVSIIKVGEDGQFERISGTSLGGGTLWGLLSLLTGTSDFDEMLALSEKGDNSSVDMLVGDIYGSDYSKIGLKSSTIASSFGKVLRRGEKGQRKDFKPEDIARSLLYAISNNIGQIAYMNAEKHNLSRIYFGGYFIRGHSATISTLSYAIRFWSKGTKRALFLRHEGYLGAIGAWLRNIEEEQQDSRR